MKHLLRFVFAVIVIAVVGALALPALIPASTYRDRVQEAASGALNREVALAGDISISVFPKLQFRATDVSIANADGFGDEAFAEMNEMRVAVRLIPLLSREVEITEFVLVEPSIRLAQRGNRNNWTFAAPGEAPPDGSGSGGFQRAPGALPIETALGDVRIEGASISYSDGSATQRIDDLDLAVRMPSVDEAAEISGTLNANGEAMSFEATLGSLRDFFEGRRTPFGLQLGGRLINAEFDGRFGESADLDFSGTFNADIPSVRALAAFAGADLPPGEQFRRFRTSGDLRGNPAQRLWLNASTLQLDALAGSGELIADLDRRRPRLRGNLDFPELDVTPYVPQSEESESSGGGGIAPWSEDEIDLAGLGIVDTDLALTTQRFVFDEIVATGAGSGAPIELRAKIVNSRLEATLENLNLYGGAGTARIVANNRQATPSFSLAANLNGLDALPFLEAAAGFDRLSGTGGLSLDVLASGASQAQLMQSLRGNGRFGFADGAVRGINVAETIRNVNAFFSSNESAGGEASDDEAASTGDNQSTDFTELGGTFTISGGNTVNQDLLMLSPLLRVEGAGSVNLASQTIDYRLRPRAVASIQGQGGNRDLRGIVVPIRIRGTFNDLSYGVDTEAVGQALLSGALSNALGGSTRDPGASNPEDIVRDGLLNALGLGQQNDPQEGDTPEGEPQGQEPVDPAELLLRNLLSRGNDEEEETTGDDRR